MTRLLTRIKATDERRFPETKKIGPEKIPDITVVSITPNCLDALKKLTKVGVSQCCNSAQLRLHWATDNILDQSAS